jgi:outer membrane protein assembly factor BamB
MTASALATAGGIVFGGTADRQFFALHTGTGELLWQMRLSGDISGAPVTFEHAGKQYVDLILLVVFGAGLTWGAAVIQW